MRYSLAFERLHAMSEMVDLHTEVKYRRVAIFLGRIMMCSHEFKDNFGRHTMQWQLEFQKFDREEVFNLVALLNDGEWAKVRGYMYKLAEKSGGRDHWKSKRIGFVTDLDTVRAFG